MDALLERLYSMRKQEIEACAKHLMLGGGTRPAPTILRGQGVWLEDIQGKKYIDCTSQSWAMYLGFANAELNRTVSEHAERISHVHQGFDTPSRFALARKLCELAPKKINRVSFTVGGAAAVEGAMKIAVKNRENAQEFICLYDAYHGTTLGVLGSNWASTRATGKFIGGARFNRLTRQFIRVPNPYCYRCPLGLEKESCGLMCLKILRLTIEKGINGPVAGILMEPLQASGGPDHLPQGVPPGGAGNLRRVRHSPDLGRDPDLLPHRQLVRQRVLRRGAGHDLPGQGAGGGVPDRGHAHQRRAGRLLPGHRGAAHLRQQHHFPGGGPQADPDAGERPPGQLQPDGQLPGRGAAEDAEAVPPPGRRAPGRAAHRGGAGEGSAEQGGGRKAARPGPLLRHGARRAVRRRAGS